MKSLVTCILLVFGAMAGAQSNVNFSDTVPAAPSGSVNVKWQHDLNNPANVSAYVPLSSLTGNSFDNLYITSSSLPTLFFAPGGTPAGELELTGSGTFDLGSGPLGSYNGTLWLADLHATDNVYSSAGHFNTVTLTADPTTAMQAATKQYVDSQGSPPLVFSNLDDSLTKWKPVCVLSACNPGGTDAPASTSQTINNVSPSLDGHSMRISETTNASSTQTNALWVYSAGSCDSCTTTTSDFEVYITNGSAADNIEFDSFIFDASDSLDFMFGTQCNQTLGFWQIANNSSPWQTSSAACNLTSGTWHHIVETFHRVPGDTSCTGGLPCEHFDTISVDGNVNVINMSYVATTLPTGWASTSGLQFQIDIGTTSSATTVAENLDEISFAEGPTAGYLPIGGGTITGPITVQLINGMSVTSLGVGTGSENLGGSLTAFSTGTGNLAVGPGVLNSNTTGSNNVGVGQGALYVNTTGTNNVALGLNSLNANTTGNENAGIGQGSLAALTTGSDNTGVGKTTLAQIIAAAGNTAIGDYAGFNSSTPMTTTSYSTFIGLNANDSVNGLTNDTVIGYNAQATQSNEIMIGNSAVTEMCWAGGRACWYSSSGVPSAALCVAGNVGSLYSNTDGGATTTLYVCTVAGTWTAK
jgi:hypothetical protein